MNMRQCIATYKFLLVLTAVMMAFAVNVSAQDNIEPKEPDVVPMIDIQPMIDLTDIANSIDYAKVRRCCIVGSGRVQVQTADCCVAGDIWRAVVFEGGNADVTSNTFGKGSGAPALGPGVFGNLASIGRRCAWVVTTLGNTAPGGIPAEGTTRVTSSTGSGVSCFTEVEHD